MIRRLITNSTFVLALALGLSSQATADIVFSEDFNGATITSNNSWTIVDNIAGGGTTTFDLNGSSGGHEAANYTGGTGRAADASSDQGGVGDYDTELISPVIDLSGYVTGSLDYLINYQAVGVPSRDRVDVDWSIDGSSWANLQRWDTDSGSFRAGPGVAASHDLPDSAFVSTFQFRYRYYHFEPSDGTKWEWYAQVDDVRLNASAVPEPSAVFLLGIAGSSLAFIRRRRK